MARSKIKSGYEIIVAGGDERGEKAER